MHRSGTSFLSRALNLSGVYLGDFTKITTNDWNYDSDNLRGHWENIDIKKLADQTLEKNNGKWDEIPNSIHISENVGKLVKKYTTELLNYPSLASGFKDPRLLLCLESWHEFLPNNFIIIGIFRHPLKVAESLKTRNGFSYEKSLNLWKEYNIKLLSHIEKYGGFLLDFDWQKEHLFSKINIINKKLGLFNTDYSDWHSSSLLHSDKTFQTDFVLPNDIKELYAKLKQKSLDHSSHKIKLEIKFNVEDLLQILSSFNHNMTIQGKYFREINERNLEIIKNISKQFSDFKKEYLEKEKILNNTIKEKEKILNNTIKEKEKILNNTIKEKDLEIENLRLAVETYQNMITEIHQSFVFRTLHKYDKTIGKIIPLRPKKFVKSTHTFQEPNNTESIVNSIKKNVEKKDIICFPIINWDFRFQRPQHILTKFAESGHRIFYFTTNLRQLKSPYEIKQKSQNVYQVEINSSIFFDIYKDKFTISIIEKLSTSFEKLRVDLNLDPIILVQFPTWEPFCNYLKKKYDYKIIFDCLDDFTSFTNVVNEREKEESALSQTSDLVLATSAYLLKKMMNKTKKCIFLPNAGEFEHFNNSPKSEILSKYNKPIIGYFGSISDWFDIELISYLANHCPHFTFIMIGHTFGANIKSLQKFPNVYFLGERPYSELPKYLHEFDVCLIPFKKTQLIEATHPIKLYEYFAAGKPVVSTSMSELYPMKDLCYIAENKEEFLKLVNLAVNENDSNLVNKRIKFASKNTWTDRFDSLYTELKNDDSFNIEHHNDIK